MAIVSPPSPQERRVGMAIKMFPSLSAFLFEDLDVLHGVEEPLNLRATRKAGLWCVL